ncbi:TetR/AcrR family transcriptional regulator [Streptomyces sp. AN091965]|uniref:TetR/AcrR family transcriptional regulator n=1 Tax=Streptomyces sp. AN091965 TaxID=2927803 RepID=UPI001F62228D|nr:TetR/AcrR family transcriptional regulator [Streptomyces sp. AN091965]MCI3928961.1 TetR/AcrR family transcriptional regulator [Streptomyces sp. AN091965]
MTPSTEPPRRRRADAERSRTAVLDAAVRLLRRRPDAGMAAVAEAAGVSRQTVYAHFSSRDDLLAAAVDRITEDAVAAMDAAALGEGPAVQALLRFLDASWASFENNAWLLQAPSAAGSAERDDARHEPVTERLVRLVERGQEAGEFTPGLAPRWLVAMTVALGHAAGDEVAAGRVPSAAAGAALRTTVLRVLGATEPG